MIPEEVKRSEMINFQKRTLRTKAEDKKKSAQEKFKQGDLIGAKNDLLDARNYIQGALKMVRSLGESGISEHSIQDDIETLWRKVIEEEQKKSK